MKEEQKVTSSELAEQRRYRKYRRVIIANLTGTNKMKKRGIPDWAWCIPGGLSLVAIVLSLIVLIMQSVQ